MHRESDVPCPSGIPPWLAILKVSLHPFFSGNSLPSSSVWCRSPPSMAPTTFHVRFPPSIGTRSCSALIWTVHAVRAFSFLLPFFTEICAFLHCGLAPSFKTSLCSIRPPRFGYHALSVPPTPVFNVAKLPDLTFSVLVVYSLKGSFPSLVIGHPRPFYAFLFFSIPFLTPSSRELPNFLLKVSSHRDSLVLHNFFPSGGSCPPFLPSKSDWLRLFPAGGWLNVFFSLSRS